MTNRAELTKLGINLETFKVLLSVLQFILLKKQQNEDEESDRECS